MEIADPVMLFSSKLNLCFYMQYLLSRGESNVFEACANGAAVAGKTVAAVVTNYIAFMALLAWVNATLSWLGGRVGYGELSFEVRTANANSDNRKKYSL